MKEKKKGFTLIELLAVIVILGVVLGVAGLVVTNIKKKAADKEFGIMEQSITDLGKGIYAYEFIVGTSEKNSFKTFYKTGNEFAISLDSLKTAGYLKSNKFISPYNKKDKCDGYLLITPTAEKQKFKGYLKCGENYTDNGKDAYDSKESFIKNDISLKKSTNLIKRDN